MNNDQLLTAATKYYNVDNVVYAPEDHCYIGITHDGKEVFIQWTIEEIEYFVTCEKNHC